MSKPGDQRASQGKEKIEREGGKERETGRKGIEAIDRENPEKWPSEVRRTGQQRPRNDFDEAVNTEVDRLYRFELSMIEARVFFENFPRLPGFLECFSKCSISAAFSFPSFSKKPWRKKSSGKTSFISSRKEIAYDWNSNLQLESRVTIPTTVRGVDRF